jgi:1-deoxy-D-xylulose-5-phosphate reductoisomerase
MNAANEVLVEQFLAGKISWIDIGKKLETLMEAHQVLPQESLETLLEIDLEARKLAT